MKGRRPVGDPRNFLGRNVGRTASFGQSIAARKALPPEANPWWWHPSRVGVAGGPAWFERELDRFDAELRVTHNKWTGLYQIWAPKPRLQSRVCWGWTLLFTVHPTDLGAPVFARLFASSVAKWSNGREYFRAIEREIERDRERAEATHRQEVIDQSMEVFNHSQIRVGYGPNNGSKFSTYHS